MNPASFSLHPSHLADIVDLHALQKICFPQDAWGYFELAWLYLVPNVVRLKAVADNKLVGFVAGEVNWWEHKNWIATICVAPSYRQQGIATALLKACEKRLPEKQIRLTVRASNANAIRLYHTLGYSQLKTWAAYYEGGEDGIVMEKAVSGEQ